MNLFKKLFFCFTILIFIGAPFVTFAGWVSTGGELFKNAHNPWFLSLNTSVIKYCVGTDGNSFSANKQIISTAIEKAFSYWNAELIEGSKALSPGSVFYTKLGDFTITQVDCTGQEDIALLFGYEALSQSQRDFIKDPTQYVSLAVRTDYNEETLKGKGFIYVSSDYGPNRLQIPSMKIEKPWSLDGNLYKVLLHELGHVFGIPHIGNGNLAVVYPINIFSIEISLMSETFPQDLLTTYQSQRQMAAPSFFGMKNSYSICNVTSAGRLYFKMPDSSHDCLELEVNWDLAPKTEDYKIHILSYSSQKSEQKLDLGYFDSIDKISSSIEVTEVIKVYFTRKQKLFEIPENFPLDYKSGPSIFRYESAATWHSGSGNKAFQFIFKQNRYVLYGLQDGLIKLLAH